MYHQRTLGQFGPVVAAGFAPLKAKMETIMAEFLSIRQPLWDVRDRHPDQVIRVEAGGWMAKHGENEQRLKQVLSELNSMDREGFSVFKATGIANNLYWIDQYTKQVKGFLATASGKPLLASIPWGWIALAAVAGVVVLRR